MSRNQPVNLELLQRVLLYELQWRIEDRVATSRWSDFNRPVNRADRRVLSNYLREYCDGVRDLEYMLQWGDIARSERESYPFMINCSNRIAQDMANRRSLIGLRQSYTVGRMDQMQVNEHEMQFDQREKPGTIDVNHGWRDVISGWRYMGWREVVWRASIALFGYGFIIAPGVIPVFTPKKWVTITVACAIGVVFGAVLVMFKKQFRERDILTYTGGYASVLLVLTGLQNGSGSSTSSS